MEDRITKAVALFKEGYNCSQAVVAAYADLYGMDQKQALMIASSFGGGIGRMRETCGAACGMFLLAGLACGNADPKDNAAKSNNYKVVQALAEEFKRRNGSLNCAELLGLRKQAATTHIAEERTETYYAKRPCAMMVEEASRIFGEYLAQKNRDEL